MKKILISILISVFIISLTITAYAATGSIDLSVSSETVIKGKTFTVTLAGTADENITGLQSTLSYDKTKLSIESKSAGSNFTDASGSDSEIAILSSGSTVAKSGTLYTITFKVLDTAQEGTTIITISDATLALVNENSEQNNVNVNSEEATITIKADDTTADKDNTTPETTNTNKTGNTTTKNTTTKLPQTGIETISILAILVLGVVVIASYISYKKYKNI